MLRDVRIALRSLPTWRSCDSSAGRGHIVTAHEFVVQTLQERGHRHLL
jgi:hypothetical protein